jgi:hypothetical protein
MAQAAMRAAERRADERRFAEDAGIAAPAYRPARFTDLVADECQWPIDEQGDLRCGAKQAAGPGQPYCPQHRAISRGARGRGPGVRDQDDVLTPRIESGAGSDTRPLKPAKRAS